MAKLKQFYNESELVFEEKSNRGNFNDYTDRKFGQLTVLGFAGFKNRNSHWYCKCECGTIKKMQSSSIVSGETVSCGCHSREQVRIRSTTHGHTKNGKSTPTFSSWSAMIARCHKENSKDFYKYGAIGIMVHDRWRKFENFLEDMGERPKGKTIDRIENDKGYYKENCRWATPKEQSNNRKSCRVIKFEDEVLNVTQWSEKIGISRATIFGRLRKGWAIKEILTKPVRKKA